MTTPRTDVRRIGLIVRKGDKNYKVGTIFWNETDSSLYLTLTRSKGGPKGSLGKFTPVDASWSIPFKDGNLEEHHIDHSAVHATGRSHVKPADEEDYLDVEYGVPLSNLRIARPLWTIVPRLAEDRKTVDSTKEGDFVITEPDEIAGRAFYLVAFPKVDPLPLQLSDELDAQGNLPNFGFFHFVMDDYVLVLIAHNNGRMVEPKLTIKIPSYRNASAWVETIDENGVTGTFKTIAR